jgi:class 3 adenylate cyclase
VREHFATLENAVTTQGGGIVKTMGDSIMAAFQNPAAALRAVSEAQRRINANANQLLWLKAGIHRGPCIVVNLNDRLDYFGSTVNIAARLPNLSQGGEVVFSDAIRSDPEVSTFLEQDMHPNTLARFQTQVKGYDEPFDLWRLKL